MEQKNETRESMLTLENRKKLSLGGVDSVEGYGPQYIKLTSGGIKMTVLGNNIKITSFNKSSGTLTADGVFSEIKYLGKSVPFLKRVFK